jgi:hypothetical protein
VAAIHVAFVHSKHFGHFRSSLGKPGSCFVSRMARRRGKLISLKYEANPRSEALSTLRGQRSADSVRRIQGRYVKHHHDRSDDHAAHSTMPAVGLAKFEIQT